MTMSAPETRGINALDAQARESQIEDHPAWPMISRMPVVLAVSIPVSHLTVRDLLGLCAGETIETTWGAIQEVPLKVGEVQVAWGEFEVVEQRMAMRLIRLA